VDWTAFALSLRLGAATVLILLPFGILVGRFLAFRHFRGKGFVEALLALPLVLPPTVLGFYLLSAFGGNSPVGQGWQALLGHSLVFSFEGLLFASVVVNIPFAVQPMQRGFEAIPPEVREAAACSGMPPWRVLWKIDLPLAWPGIVTGLILAFAHTLGEFGVVLMVGGSISRRNQDDRDCDLRSRAGLDNKAAGVMSVVLLLLSVIALGVTTCFLGGSGVAMTDRRGLHVRFSRRHHSSRRRVLMQRRSELLAMVGPSGAGKSTTLRIIAGLYRPSEGTVTCNGSTWLDTKRGIDLPPHQRRVGLVFQNYALFPHMTALGNVAAAMGHRPASERVSRAHELLALVHLENLEQRRPADLSGGQQQRVAVARALAREPAVLLLDEPFSAVDRRTRRKLHIELAELRKAVRIPIVLVTHDIDEAAGLADRMCVIDRGETLQTARPADLLVAPASARVASALDLPDDQSFSPSPLRT